MLATPGTAVDSDTTWHSSSPSHHCSSADDRLAAGAGVVVVVGAGCVEEVGVGVVVVVDCAVTVTGVRKSIGTTGAGSSTTVAVDIGGGIKMFKNETRH